VSQTVTELLTQPEPDAIVSQDAIELLSQPTPSAVVSQSVVEILSSLTEISVSTVFTMAGAATFDAIGEAGEPGPFRVTQVLAEISEDPGISDTLFSQVVAETGQDPNETRFSQVVAEAAQSPTEIRISQILSEAVQSPNELRVTQIIAEIAQENVPVPTSGPTRVTQLFLSVLVDRNAEEPVEGDECTGGGIVATGIDPTDGLSLATATTPLEWLEFTTSGDTPVTMRLAKVAINAATRKEPRVLSFGSVTRALTEGYGGFESAAISVLLSDHDRVLRGYMYDGSLEGRGVSLYAADIETIRTAGTPRRLLSGIIREIRPEDQLTFLMVVEDILSVQMTSAQSEELRIPGVLSDYVYGTLYDADPVDEVATLPLPLAYGELSDENLGDEALGVIELKHTLNTSRHFNQTDPLDPTYGLGLRYMRVFPVCVGVVKDIISIFGADYVTGGEEPTTRAKIPEAAYGDWIFAPHKPGWPWPDPWYEIDGYRFTVVMLREDHVVTRLAEEGRIPLTMNLCGYETVGDGSGEMIDSLPRQFLHFLNNFVLNRYIGVGDWNTIALDGNGVYSAIDTQSFEDVKTVTEARVTGGYKGAVYIGGDFQTHGVRQVIGDFCTSGDFDLGVNKHGQLFLTILNTFSAHPSAPVVDDQHNIIKGSFRIEPKFDEIENEIQYVYERNYIQTLGGATQTEEAIAHREPFDGKWWSGLQKIRDDTSVTNMGGDPRGLRKSQLLQLHCIRLQAIADDIAQRRLDLRKNRRAAALMAVRLEGDDIELGDIVKVTDFQGLGPTGWTEKRCQVRRHIFGVDQRAVQLVVRDVDDLLL
jgi:hypothetical protein